MERYQVVLATGIVISAILGLINIYVGGIAFILVIALVMSMLIMRDTVSLADVGVRLSADAKHISVVNTGNIEASNIHVSLVPIDREFDIEKLGPGESREFGLESMIDEAKAVVVFKTRSGETFRKSINLSSHGTGDDDLLKPMFPLFRQE
ncbi:MAG TPA: hypothetical protein VMC42_01885 [Methanoregulaceae archaeon]|nr:hypothetical protein [Methanoregulaceae archaeon]